MQQGHAEQSGIKFLEEILCIFTVFFFCKPPVIPMSALRLVRPMAGTTVFPTVPGVWHADTLRKDDGHTQASGHALLDAHLPGGGWPLGALSEVLQPQQGGLEWALVLPALARAMAQRSGVVVLVAPPCEPLGHALEARGLASRRLCVVRAAEPAGALWATEQALRSRDVLGVMAWLPQAPTKALRRLQLAAAQLKTLVWVFRNLNATVQASPALLRLHVQALGQTQESGAVVPGMQVRILKRQGPPLARALELPTGPDVLSQVLAAQAARRQAMQQAASAWLAERKAASPPFLGQPQPGQAQTSTPSVSPHALARIALALAR